MFRRDTTVLILVTLLLTATASAQGPVITDVSPAAASAGDEITITGTFPNTITHARFLANVGGFVGVDFKIVAVTSATATQVKVTVPVTAAFAPPNAIPPGDPYGTVLVRDAGGIFSPSVPFFFNQGAYRDQAGAIVQLESIGLGSTNSLGCRAATSFDITTGPPNTGTGNPGFQMTLENATPFSSTVILLGTPAAPPTVPISDGLFPLDLSQTILAFPPMGFVMTDANGEFVSPIAIPVGPFNLPLGFVHAYFDGGAGQFQISTGLIIYF